VNLTWLREYTRFESYAPQEKDSRSQAASGSGGAEYEQVRAEGGLYASTDEAAGGDENAAQRKQPPTPF
jgi:hypothetical protein